MTSLTEFLLARLAEDEAEALASIETGYQPPSWGPEDKPDPIPDFYDPPSDLDRKRAARELADVAAKRRIVLSASDLLRAYERHGETGDEVRDEAMSSAANIYEAILGELATVYADHPDFDESWRP